MLEGLAAAGVRRVRFTGGEPLLYPALESVVAHAVHLGFDDVALTTNATRLAARAAALRAAGLQRVTVLLDSLDPARFARLTRGGRLAEVLAGIQAAVAAGFDEVKLNCVVLRGENDQELEAIARFAWARGIVPRFLEVMAVGEGARLVADHLVTVAEMRERLAALLESGGRSDRRAEPRSGPLPARAARCPPADRFHLGDQRHLLRRLRSAARGGRRIRPPVSFEERRRQRAPGRRGRRRARDRGGRRARLGAQARRADLERLHRSDRPRGVDARRRRLSAGTPAPPDTGGRNASSSPSPSG